ncbi:MAG: DNA polymerase III subunit delta [Acidimicrobiales bacterium]
MTAAAEVSAYLVKGDDPVLVATALQELVHDLNGEADLSMAVEEHGAGGEDIDTGAVVDALSTPPMLCDRRIVVVREAGRLLAADGARIAAAMEQLAPGVVLVVAAGGGTVPAALVKAVGKAGNSVDTAVGRGRARDQWLEEHLGEAPVRLDARARALVSDHLGDDMARLGGLLETLRSAYGEGSSIGPEKLEPFLGEAGAVPPWELTDAIDRGDTPGALDALARLGGAGDLHPLQIMAMLHRHYQGMLRLDGLEVASADEAAALLGMRSHYPARKVMEQGRRLGASRIGRAVSLLAEADLDLRGRTGLPDSTVLEILVARLSRLGAGRETAGRRGARRSAAGRR